MAEVTPLYLLDLLRQAGSDVRGHMGHHHPGGTEGGELLVHESQALPGLRGVRQVLCDIVAEADPVPRKQAKNQAAGIEKEDEISLVYNERGQLFKKGRFSGFFAHNFNSS